MIEVRTYSIDELVDLTGFSQRNIAYYIQQGLLPKVGRRGRKTRYPQLFVDRLRFIQRVRDLQDAGRLGSVTLPRIARIIWYLVEESGEAGDLPELDDRELQQLLENESIADERELGVDDDWGTVTAGFGQSGPFVRAAHGTAPIDAEDFNSITLHEALRHIDESIQEDERYTSKKFEDEERQVREGSASWRRDRLSSRVQRRDPTDVGAKLDLARAYVEMGDPGGARRILDEVLEEGGAEVARLLELEDEYEALAVAGGGRLAKRELSRLRDKLAAHTKGAVRDKTVESYSADLAEPSSLDDLAGVSEESTRSLEFAEIESLADDSIYPEPDLARLIEDIERQVRKERRRGSGRTETWTRAPITDNIEITVRGIDPEHAELVEWLAQRIRKLLGVD